MKAVILAGGYGTRISEESNIRPKPMIEIGGKPILWHIMKIYSAHGVNDFVICCGYKGHMIKEYFINSFFHACDFTIDMREQDQGMRIHTSYADPWRVTVVDTGEKCMTGGRLKRVQEYLDGEPFCMTYGDGVGDINITELIAFHESQKEQGAKATLTATHPPGRFGAFTLRSDDSRIDAFNEKPDGDGAWINGGFFVLEPDVFDYIDGDATVWEREPLEGLARDGALAAYRHHGFWQPMDTLRDKSHLEELWTSGKAPWKIWSESQAVRYKLPATDIRSKSDLEKVQSKIFIVKD